MYIVPKTTFWILPQDPILENRDKEIDKIYRLLNSPSHLANEQRLGYVTTEEIKPWVLIFVGFDLVIKLGELKKWAGL
jgi:hypothetical protein